MYDQHDRDYMLRALELAARGMNTTMPNPRVGCLIVRDDRVVGEGWHRRAGEPHAEALALAQAGDRARGATVYVTLEPCTHFGRTPPCTGQLIDAGVRRVVAAMEDPNPKMRGQGLQRLRDAGIDVRCGLLEAEARALNPGFVARMTRQRPWVRMKVAASIDGRTALPDGRSQWITGEAARRDGHRWRARASAVLTGIGTVRDDDPRLTVRDVEVVRQPLRVIVDSHLAIGLDARVLHGGALVFSALPNADKERELRDRGCEVVVLPDAHRRVDLARMLDALARREINEVHVEAGSRLNGALLQHDCVDELLVYVGPRLLGAGRPLADLAGPGSLDLPPVFELVEVQRIETDARLLYRRIEAAPPAAFEPLQPAPG